jgi:outer membrane murein-binding lipoprotein Lpp
MHHIRDDQMNTPDNRADSQPDTGDAARWMTFAELARIREISRDSAVTLVRRHGWRRQRDNQGHVIALVPLTWATPESASKPGDRPDKQPDSHPDSLGYIAAFEVALSAVRQAKDGEIAALRQRADTLRDRVEDLQVQVVQLEEAGARLSAQAEAAEARASRAEGELGGERIRAHTLSSHVEGYRADLERVRRELTAAQIAQSKAETDAAELRQANAERRARGRLARAWRAWRGE